MGDISDNHNLVAPAIIIALARPRKCMVQITIIISLALVLKNLLEYPPRGSLARPNACDRSRGYVPLDVPQPHRRSFLADKFKRQDINILADGVQRYVYIVWT